MKTFLQETAQDLYRKHGDHLSDIAVVFPNNRARLFFNRALYEVAGKPIWTPKYLSLSDLFKTAATEQLTVADPLRVNGLLYQCYRNIFPESEETFDQFYGWGNILISDFDNVDKNCVDARQLFRNISEQASYEDTFEHLSDNQKQVLARFFGCIDISKSKSRLKQQFVKLWNQMFNLYTDLQEQLLQRGLAYEGMFNRRAIDSTGSSSLNGSDLNGTGLNSSGFDVTRFTAEKYVFVGFNALNVCEMKLFDHLRDAGKALFYWDYDPFFVENELHEAGRFLRDNLKRYPNELDASHFHNYKEVAKKIHLIASPTETAQAHYAGQWLKESSYPATETAIVLCNEGLLLPMLHCIPDDIKDLNVTMGYPMTQTPVFNLLRQVTLLHTDGYRDGRFRSKFTMPVLQNPYLLAVCPEAKTAADNLIGRNLFSASKEDICAGKSGMEGSTEEDDKSLLSLIFTPLQNSVQIGQLLMELIRRLAKSDISSGTDNFATTGNDTNTGDDANTGHGIQNNDAEIFLPLYQESLFQCYTAISHLNDMLLEGLFEVSGSTYRKLLLKVLSAAIPFSGEPLRGIQLMGLLETRNLDFRNVLLMSVNEGTIPKKALDSSFIPYNLRMAFGLTGPEHQDAISAYYFFRFLERAENITCIYNSSTEGMNRGEMSRFLLQLKMESTFDITESSLTAPVSLAGNKEIAVEKGKNIFKKIPHRLSPSAINAYLDCPLKFYFQNVEHLKAEDEISEDIDGALFGTMFHAAAQHVYTHLMLLKQGKPCDISSTELFMEERENQKDAEPIQVNVQADDVKAMLKDTDYLEQVVDRQFQREVFKSPAGKPVPLEQYNGEQRIQHKLILLFLKRLLDIDHEYAPFDILGLETRIGSPTPLKTSDGTTFTTGGIIDRIDRKGDTIRIVDYKTGGQPESPNMLDDLFTPDKNRAHYMLQTFLYASLLHEKILKEGNSNNLKIKPVLLFIHKAYNDSYSPDLSLGHETVNDIRPYETDFREKLGESLTPLFDPAVPFTQTALTDKCQYCDFCPICRR